jgi:hypothetical protein
MVMRRLRVGLNMRPSLRLIVTVGGETEERRGLKTSCSA